MSMDFRGDPSSALLEVLDPEQNYTFNDHYLDVDYDLSNVMFITTANVRYPIPLPPAGPDGDHRAAGLSPSTTSGRSPGGTSSRSSSRSTGLRTGTSSSPTTAIDKMIAEYTREAGVRNLEREIATVCRKLAKDIVVGKRTKEKKATKIEVTAAARGDISASRFRQRDERRAGRASAR